MDFNANRGNRNTQPSAGAPGAHRPAGVPGGDSSSSDAKNKFSFGNKKPGKSDDKTPFFSLKFASIALLFSATILVVALLVFLALGKPTKESGFVEHDKYQAAFLNGGQVYFGQVTDLNSEYMRLVDIYYLRVNQQVQPAEGEEAALPQEGDISLVKLGCELHGPKDEMLINRDQIVFWENLKDDGQVSQAIAEFKAENPDGQDCEDLNQGELPEQPAPAPDPEGFEAAPPEEEDEE